MDPARQREWQSDLSVCTYGRGPTCPIHGSEPIDPTMLDRVSFSPTAMNTGPGDSHWDRLDDVALIEEAARGEVDALATLYDRFATLMLAVAERILGDRPMAEDLVHDVFVEVWRNAAKYDPGRGSVRSWVLVRLRSRAIDRRRAAYNRREVATHELPHDIGVQTDEAIVLAPDRRAVRIALADLPPDQREVLELGYFHGLTSSEIAERTGSPLGTVKSRTAAGLAKLRSAMKWSGGIQ